MNRPGGGSKPRAFLCDFDGTVAPEDIGALFVRRFTRAPERELELLTERWRAGRVGTRQVIEAESASLVVGEAEALGFTRGYGLDPEFGTFAREVVAAGGRVVVVSEGYDFYVRDQLERAGLGELPWSANRARFEGGRVRVEFPRRDSGCGSCGNCKGAHVEDYRGRGYEVVLVGDGLSDRCGARLADLVLARGELLGWCASVGIAAQPFASFLDVARWARARAGSDRPQAPAEMRPAAGDGAPESGRAT